MDKQECKLRKRPSWKSYFISVAKLISERSVSNKLQVGCVITKDNRILSSGYNGYISGVEDQVIIKDGHEIFIHSECNAICDAAKRGTNIDGGTIYITHYPCLNCTTMIIASGIKKIVYYDDYKNDEIAKNMLNTANIIVEKYQDNNERAR